MTGTQISDMTISANIPEGGYVPFVITSDEPGFSLTSNYIYDLGTDLLTRVSYTALAAPAGAGLVGKIGGGTVQGHIDDLASSIGSTMVGFLQSGTGAVLRTAQDKGRENVTPGDYTGGLEVAVSAVRNGGDPAFSGGIFVPNGSTNLTSPISLTDSFVRVKGSAGGTFLQAPADHVFEATGGDFFQSEFSGFRTYSGNDAFHIWPVGEIASINFTDIVASQFEGDAFSFAAGLTSSKFMRIVADSTLGNRGIYCDSGINNDVAITDCDFTNLTGPAIKTGGLTQLWRINGLRVEENGQAGVAVFDLTSAVAVHVKGSWFEKHHEYLLKLTGDSDDGVLFDGCIDAGAKDGVGLKASLFDVGTNRVLFGSNHFSNRTIAPSRCFIYGVTKNLATDDSTVHARALNASEYAVSKKRTFAAPGDLVFDFLTVTRPSDDNIAGNQQVVWVEMNIVVSGYVSGGIPRSGVWKARFPVSCIGNTIFDPDAYVVVDTGVGNIGTLTVAVAKSAAPTSTAVTMKITITNLDTSAYGFCQYDLRILNTSSTDAYRASVSIL